MLSPPPGRVDDHAHCHLEFVFYWHFILIENKSFGIGFNLLSHQMSKESGDWDQAAGVGDDDEVDRVDGEEEDAQHRLLDRVAEVLGEAGGGGQVDHHHGKVDVRWRRLADRAGRGEGGGDHLGKAGQPGGRGVV